MSVTTIAIVALGIFFLALYLGGLSVGFGIIKMINSIPWYGWTLILFFILWGMGSKKR